MLTDHGRRSLEERTAVGPADRVLRRAGRAAWPAAVVALTVGSRLLVSRDRRQYVLWPDEPAQLAFARFVAGGARWNMHDHSTWKPGYGLVVGFVGSGTTEPADLYRVAMVTNAVLAGIAAWVLYALTRRLTDLGRGSAGVAVAGAVMLPGSLFVSGYAWSEPLTVATLLGSLLAMIAFDARPGLARGLLAGGVAGAGFASHTRLLPVLGLVVALAVIARRRGDLSRTHLTVVAVWCGGLFLAVTWVSRALVDRLWNEPLERNSYGGFLDQITRPHDALVAMLGQAWYLAMSTGGLAAMGALALVSTARSRRWEEASRRVRATRVTLVVLGVQLVVSGMFMAGRWRGDHVVYGRYNDAFVGVLVVAGSCEVVRRCRRATLWWPCVAIAGGMAASWFALDRLRGRQLAEGGVVDAMVLGLQAFGNESSIPLASITLVAMGIVVGTSVVAGVAGPRVAPIVLAAVAVGLLWVGIRHTTDVVQPMSARDERALAALNRVEGLDVAAYFLAPASTSTGQMMRYQSVLPATRFTVVDALDETLTIDAVFAPRHDRQLEAAGYGVIWSDPSHDLALWRQRSAGER